MKFIIASIFFVFSVIPASALDIVLVESGSSAPPLFDSGGDKLEAILEAAAEMWEDIIEDPGTFTITWSWDSLGLGLANGFNTSLSAPWAGEINFDNAEDRLWFFDPTPHDHSEFALERVVLGTLETLAPGEQALRFGGTPPTTLEVSYAGSAVEQEAMGAFDALTSALHEIGHALALSGNLHFDFETSDSDFDVPSEIGGGVGFAINGIAGEPFHLEPNGGVISPPLMCGNCASPGRRRLPTATDVLAVATALYAGNGVNGTMFWSDLDLPRKTWNGGTTDIWETAEAWIGGAVPDSEDAVFISDGDTLRVTDRISVDEVFIDDPFTDLYVDSILHTRNIEIDSADLRMNDGLVTADRIDLQTGVGALSVIGGGGTIEFESLIENDGRIFGGSNQLGEPVLKLVGGSSASIDYDGQNEQGEIQSLLGDLEFTGAQTDDYDGYLIVAAGRRMTFFNGFNLGTDGIIQLDGGTTPDQQGTAVLDGTTFGFAGRINVDGESRIANAGSTFLDGCFVDLETSDSRLALGGGTIILEGAGFVGPGRLVAELDLFLFDGSDVGVELQSSGRLVLQRALAGAATASVESLDLKSDASLRLIVGDGADPALGDRLVVTADAKLSGTLRVVLDTPGAQPGQRWTVLTIGGTRSGTFANVIGVDLPVGMRLEPIYFENRVEVVLQQVLSYDDWRAGYSFANGADSQSGSDPDEDGSSNLHEYFFGTDPLDPTVRPAINPIIYRELGEAFGAVKAAPPLAIFATDAELFAEFSRDLASWSEGQTTLVGAKLDSSGARRMVYRSNSTLADVPRQFLRVDVRLVGP